MTLTITRRETPPGLPHALPEDERVLWQGRPAWRPLAVRTFRMGWLSFYFGVIATFRVAVSIVEGRGIDPVQLVAMLGLFAACMGILAGVAWLNARATLYTITTRRVVMHIGAALSMSWNLPFRRLAAADLDLHPEGDGDIVLRLSQGEKVRWLYFWPHVQMGRLVDPRPALRTVPDAANVARILARAVASWAASEDARVVVSKDLPDTGPPDGGAVAETLGAAERLAAGQ